MSRIGDKDVRGEEEEDDFTVPLCYLEGKGIPNYKRAVCCWLSSSEGLQSRRSSTYWRNLLGERWRVGRSLARAWPKRWGLSRNP
jgi:hypothetical protein